MDGSRFGPGVPDEGSVDEGPTALSQSWHPPHAPTDEERLEFLRSVDPPQDDGSDHEVVRPLAQVTINNPSDDTNWSWPATFAFLGLLAFVAFVLWLFFG
jgi:hypothetical protein